MDLPLQIRPQRERTWMPSFRSKTVRRRTTSLKATQHVRMLLSDSPPWRLNTLEACRPKSTGSESKDTCEMGKARDLHRRERRHRWCLVMTRPEIGPCLSTK